jgi:HK97 family phage portal protein
MMDRVLGMVGLQRRSLANPSDELLALFGAVPTAAAMSVTPETAMRLPVLYAAVKVLAESVAQLPLILYRRNRDGDGGKERARDHPLFSILHDQANPWTSATEFRLHMQSQLCLHGNAFAFINRDTTDRVAELVQIPARLVTVEADDVTMEPEYLVTGGDGAQRRYGPDEIFHLRTIGTGDHPHLGDSPVTMAREAIALALAMEKHAGRIFGNGARPAGILKAAKALGPETIKRLRESFQAQHAGGENAGRTLVLEERMDFEQTQFSSVDLQFLELRRHQIAEIARVFRIPLSLLQDLERVTHSNAEALGQQFVSLALMFWLKLWEGAIRRALIDPAQRDDLSAEFLVDDLVRADIAARFNAYSQAVTNGILSPNEVRALENRGPYGGGDEFRLPMNTEAPGQDTERSIRRVA